MCHALFEHPDVFPYLATHEISSKFASTSITLYKDPTTPVANCRPLQNTGTTAKARSAISILARSKTSVHQFMADIALTDVPITVREPPPSRYTSKLRMRLQASRVLFRSIPGLLGPYGSPNSFLKICPACDVVGRSSGSGTRRRRLSDSSFGSRWFISTVTMSCIWIYIGLRRRPAMIPSGLE